MSFPKDFVWGAASSSIQIEGHSMADGGGASIWDTFSHIPGKINENSNPDIACDSYHRYEEDLQHLLDMGLKNYRFSTSWARIDPNGDGSWNPGGLDYYDRLVDACLAKGITPWMTLYHWELPQALEDQGGWMNRETAYAFGRFASMMAAHFKGRVSNYFTINEPQCIIGLGYGAGVHAPGKQLSDAEQFNGWCNVLLAHGLGTKAIREADPSAKVGLATTGRICYPLEETDACISAARTAAFDAGDMAWVWTHHLFLDPVVLGKFPNCTGPILGPLVAQVTAEDLAIMHQVPDMLGMNTYNGFGISAAEDGSFVYETRYDGFPRTALKWPVTPECLDWGMRFMYERYQLPIFISENGLSCNDKIYLDGQVHDLDRIDFLHRYLRCLRSACEHGADIRGYFHWSLTDNFEWHSGYSERFGLYFVDYPTQNRIAKDSSKWYAGVVSSNGESL